MSNKNKKILDGKLKNAAGGFQIQQMPWYTFRKDRVIPNPEEARLLNLEAGKEYARDDLEDAILKNAPYKVLSSDIRRKLKEHKTIDDMTKILIDDFHFKQE